MATCQYEMLRQQKIAENKRRIEQLGLQQMSQSLVEAARARRAPAKPRVPTIRNPAAADLVRVPARRSARGEGKPAPNYNESALDHADRIVSRKNRQPFLGEVRPTSVEEEYTQEDIALLGDYTEPWELFVDGCDASGKRVYDKVNGMTCHQCRQKTLGKHTSCSCCNSLQGVLCGDCLFMRYGENILEVQKKEEWTCPVCRGLCNCSNHRIRKGWAPTGTLYRRAIAEGYRSVAHYLVLTQQKTADSTAAEKPAPVPSSSSAKPVPAAAADEPAQPSNAEPEPVVSTTTEEDVNPAPVQTTGSKRQTVQQTLVTLLPQSKVTQATGVAKLGAKKRNRDDDSKKSFGLASALRRTRSQCVAAV